jgi:Tfp pilus assembly protein PilN
MLKQEINLYRSFEEPTPVSEILSFQQLCRSTIFAGIIFTLMFFSSLWHLHQLKNTKTTLTQQAIALDANLTNLKNAYPQIFFYQNAQQSIEQLQKQLDTQEKILNTLVHITPFSQQLTLLAKIIMPDVWLTEISIQNSGATIILFGNSRSTQAMQLFIQRIFQEPAYAKYQLQLKNIESQDKTKTDENLSFTLTLTKVNE